MSEYFDQLKRALEEYFQAIEELKNPALSSKASLRNHFEKLDALSSKAPVDLHPQLAQKSYEKALNFVSGNASKNTDGGCSR